ncbi:sigma-70 family RNA polymerase sigma factor [Tenggerimyces flavus]|uniref:Sigma-70 family RNA polymerase sigma factor n=1 Tax=Tenggerimyces flavus TaxID=1708749 RepID=A0ABV7YNH1_9ACTN|nr:sigma-70 family RNA polymerase sigma factor [Tenggerimyces flavus]MBM7784779.1 RNA polymerase sigma-70 factor (ECF subfamily) [Tenggerimyces flavus]
MSDLTWLADRFEEHRTQLRAVAYRMLGSTTDAEDVVQEAWLRLSRSDPNEVRNLGGWLTTVVARVCLDQLRSRKARREEPADDPPDGISTEGNPEHEAELADSVGVAMLVVLDTLDPAERLAFVLHDMFAVPFDEIAPIVGRTSAAARMLASRARRRVQGAGTTYENRDASRQREIVEAFLTAARGGDLRKLVEILDPDVVFRADAAARANGATEDLHGAQAVAAAFNGRAQAARVKLLDGVPGLLWADHGVRRAAFLFTFADDRVATIALVADTESLTELEVTNVP